MLAREVRMQGLAESNALAAMDQFDTMVSESFRILTLGVADFDLATSYIKHFATKLRAGDALYLAMASNHGAETFYTLDQGLLAAANLLKVSASRGI